MQRCRQWSDSSFCIVIPMDVHYVGYSLFVYFGLYLWYSYRRVREDPRLLLQDHDGQVQVYSWLFLKNEVGRLCLWRVPTPSLFLVLFFRPKPSSRSTMISMNRKRTSHRLVWCRSSSPCSRRPVVLTSRRQWVRLWSIWSIFLTKYFSFFIFLFVRPEPWIWRCKSTTLRMWKRRWRELSVRSSEEFDEIRLWNIAHFSETFWRRWGIILRESETPPQWLIKPTRILWIWPLGRKYFDFSLDASSEIDYSIQYNERYSSHWNFWLFDCILDWIIAHETRMTRFWATCLAIASHWRRLMILHSSTSNLDPEHVCPFYGSLWWTRTIVWEWYETSGENQAAIHVGRILWVISSFLLFCLCAFLLFVCSVTAPGVKYFPFCLIDN